MANAQLRFDAVETPGRVSDSETTTRLLLTIREAAHALGIGRSKAYELIAAGELETVHIGRACRVPLDAVHGYIGRLRRA